MTVSDPVRLGDGCDDVSRLRRVRHADRRLGGVRDHLGHVDGDAARRRSTRARDLAHADCHGAPSSRRGCSRLPCRSTRWTARRSRAGGSTREALVGSMDAPAALSGRWAGRRHGSACVGQPGRPVLLGDAGAGARGRGPDGTGRRARAGRLRRRERGCDADRHRERLAGPLRGLGAQLARDVERGGDERT